MVRRSTSDALVAWVTFAATLALAPRVEQGVLVGILLSLAFGVRRRRTG
jgi:MFS superfamily sulfate permease-like transporter